MKKILLILTLIFMFVLPVFGQTGSLTTNEYFYLPEYGAYGTVEYDEYNTYMEIADNQIEANKDAIVTDLTDFVEQTAWRLFYSDGSGDVTELVLGASGTYLGSSGAASAPTFSTPGGAGDMLKATYDTDADDEIDVAGGGTEKASWTQYCIPYLSGTTAFGEIPIGTDNYALTVNGSTGYDWTRLQVYDDGLQSISGLTTAANDMIYTTALDTYAIMDTFSELQAVVADKTLINEEDAIILDQNLAFEGTANDYETTFTITDPTADRAITFQDAAGIVVMDVTACTDMEGTLLSISTGTLNVAIPEDHLTATMLKDDNAPADEDIYCYESTGPTGHWYSRAEVGIGTATSITDGLIVKADFAASTDFGNISTDASKNWLIDDDTILEADLKAVDAAADEDFLTYESTTGDFEWHSIADISAGIAADIAEGELADSIVVSADIKDGVIAEADLKIVDSPTDEDIFTYESTTGDFEWHTKAELGIGTATSITDDLIVEADINVDESPDDNDILTFDTTDDNFSWQTPAELITAGTAIAWTGTTLNVTLRTEAEVKDWAGDMFTGNTETLIAATYQTDDDTVDLVVTIPADHITAAMIDAVGCGTNCTWDTTNDEIDIDDVFLLHAGDVASGVMDFGGCDSFEIPNKDADPSVTGQILLDTSVADMTNGNVAFYDGTAIRYVVSLAAGQIWSDDDYVVAYDATNDYFYMKEDADSGGAGDVTKVGTPVDNQIGVWTGDGTIEGDANLTYDGTTLVLGTGQINFPDSQNASADVNTFDDYEEGTWTPVYEGDGGTIGATAYTAQVGHYTKIGRNVHLVGHFALSNNGDWTNNVIITGLPFTSANTGDAIQYIGSVWSGNITFADQIVCRIGANSSIVVFRINTSGAAGSYLQTTGVPDNGAFYFSITYFTE